MNCIYKYLPAYTLDRGDQVYTRSLPPRGIALKRSAVTSRICGESSYRPPRHELAVRAPKGPPRHELLVRALKGPPRQELAVCALKRPPCHEPAV